MKRGITVCSYEENCCITCCFCSGRYSAGRERQAEEPSGDVTIWYYWEGEPADAAAEAQATIDEILVK